MRSVSHAPNCFAIESFMDELAHAAGKNPYEFRRALLKAERSKKVLEVLADKSGWGKAPPGRYQGMSFMLGYTTHIAQVAEISIDQGELKVHRIVCVVDCGYMVHPKIVESQIEGGTIFGLTAALWGEINLKGGKARETNFHNYRLLRMNEVPAIEVHLLDSDEAPGGIGEAAVALPAPALCNAIFSATGKRIRKLPIGVLKLA
jgi:CO/xanthine dehydrogenase Mo-binding subunit